VNILARELVKYERRVNRIKTNPDPAKMRSNSLLYELWCDLRRSQIAALEQGKPVVYLAMEAPARVFLAMGFHVVHLLLLADRLAAEAPEYIPRARGAGYPDFVCGRVPTAAGLLMSGDLPRPSLIVTDTSVCNAGTLVGLLAHHYLKVPVFTIDSDGLTNDYQSVAYVAGQIREAIEFAERTVPGVKYDEQALVALQGRQSELHHLEHEIKELKKAVPCPISTQDSLKVPPYIEMQDARIVDYYRSLVGELTERVREGKSAVAVERMRLYWLVSLPFYADIFGFLERNGMTVPLFEPSASDDFRRFGNDEQYGRHLTPLEEEAAFILGIVWAGDTKRRVQDILKNAREFRIDGLVHFQQAGCTPNLGNAQIVARRVREELGIPSVFIDGCCLDSAKFNQEEFERKMLEFLELHSRL